MNSKDKSALMAESKLFSGLSPEECISLEKALTPVYKTFLKGEVIFREGERLGQTGIIIKGRVNGEKFYHDGKSHLVHTFDVTDVIGLETICSSVKDCAITFTAAEETAALMIDHMKLTSDELIPPALMLKISDNMIRILADQNIKSMYKMEVLSKKSLRSRVIIFLKIMQNKLDVNTFCIKMSREQFAEYLCVNRSALSHELKEMQREGLITFNKDQFTINH